MTRDQRLDPTEQYAARSEHADDVRERRIGRVALGMIRSGNRDVVERP